jgi:hypothetical protein
VRGRRTAGGLVAGGLALHTALMMGLLGPLPDEVRVVLAFLVLVLLPGYAFVALGARPPGGAWLASGWALGFGVAWLGALILGTRVLGVPFTVLSAWSLIATALLWAFVGWRSARRARGAVTDGAPKAARGSRVWLLAVMAAAAVGAWHAARLGAPLAIITDSPDHVGTIRRMLASGDAFPRDAFFKDAGDAGADPRKGLWHPGVALVAKLAAADPVTAWRILPACLVPLFVINLAVFGFLLRGPPAAAAAAWALLLTYGGSLAEQFLREAVFATKLGDQLALATACAVLADLTRPSRRLRLAATGLALGALAAHVYYAIQFAMVFSALGAGLLIADRGWSARVSRLAGTAATLGLACVPYLGWRWGQSYAPRNIIHTEPQGLLWIFDGVRIVHFGVLWDWMGSAWVLFPLAAPWLWRAGRHDPAVLYLLTTPIAVALVIFDPPVVALLEPRLGYLLMRVIWMVPLAGLLAWIVTGLAREARYGRERWRPAVALAGVLALCAGALGDAAEVLAHPANYARQEARWSPMRWADALGWMDARLPAGTVVLSDPATSYSVPMMTRHYVVTLLDQHSSPNDSLALTRILDSRDALDPWGSWARLREVAARYGVGAVALNDRFAEPPMLDYWSPRHAWFAAERARLDREPAAFERVFDSGDFVVYRVRRAALDTLATTVPPRPFVLPWQPAIGPPERQMAPHLPGLCRFALYPRDAAPGDTLVAVADWRAPEPLPAGAYVVALRCDRVVPRGAPRPPEFLAKPARKIVERLRGERYRFRVDHLPAGGAYGVDLWRPDQVVRDTFAIVIPPDVADGDYTVRIRMLRQPHYPNFRLRDLFYEDDYYAGLRVGPLRVRRHPVRGGR